MSLYTILARCLGRSKKNKHRLLDRLQAAPLSPRQLERRRVLDAAGADALLSPLADSSETVQVGENISLDAEDTNSTDDAYISSVGPQITFLDFSVSSIDENGVTDLQLVIDDQGNSDTHTVNIDWGDGQSDTVTLDPGQTVLSVQHQFLDDPAGTGSNEQFTVGVTVTNTSGESTSSSKTIEVLNLDPEITFFDIAETSIDENGVATLQLSFTDDGSLDTNAVGIDWGDGDTEMIFLSAGQTVLSIQHQYLDDDPTGTLSDEYTVAVTVTDDDGGTDTASDTITVNNLDPAINFFDIVETSIDENGIATLQLAFTDVGAQDNHTVDIDWGDGNTETIDLSTGQTALSIQHQYLDDDPSGTLSDIYTVNVTVTDDDGGTVTASDTITVNNLDPEITFFDIVETSIDENGIANLQLSFTDVGSLDTHTVEIDWGDGTTETVNLSLGQTTLTLQHQYLDDDPTGTLSDVYTVNVTVTDDDGGTDTASDTITVNNLDPEITFFDIVETSIDENGIATLQLSFTDIGSLDTHTVDIDWGDGTTETINLSLGQTTLTLQHQYLDDDPTGTLSDVYTVNVTVTDDDGGTDTASDTITVNNLDPEITFFDIVETSIDENGIATLQLSFTDIGSLDTHTVDIDWGDGTTETINLSLGQTTLTLQHQYLDDDPSGTLSDIYTVNVTVTDDDGGTDTASDTITVNNLDPEITFFDIVETSIDENGIANLQLSFTDVGSLDTHTVDIDWGDGTTETVNLSLGQTTLTIQHQYLDDDPSGTLSDVYTVNVTVTDDDGGTDTASDTITVNNLDPEITFFDIVETSIDENGIATLQLSFTDVGSLDTHTVDIDWGDGTTETVNLSLGQTTLTIQHQYLDDDPSGTLSDVYTVNVTVTDDDGGTDTASDTITVNNLDPEINFFDIVETSIDENGIATLQLSFTDVGSLDTHTVDIDWGDGTTETVNLSLGQTTLTIQHQYLDDDPSGTLSDVYTVNVTVTDDDGGTDTASDTITVNNLDPEITFFDIVETSIDENGIATLQLSFTDVGSLDTHTVDIDWGDGTTETISLSAGQTVVTLQHQYLDDDPSGTLSDVYTVNVTVTDDDGGTDTASDTITVNNLDPEITFFDIVETSIDENGIATLQLSFTDVGSLDTHTVDIDWGDGTTETVNLSLGQTTLTIQHQYLDDDPSGTLSDVYTVNVTVTDDDGGTDTASDTITVNNLDPEINFFDIVETSIDENGIATLQLSFTDIGSLDTHTVDIDWGDGTTETVNLSLGQTTLTIQHQYLDDDPSGTLSDVYTVNVTVTDDDGGTDTASDTITVNNLDPEITFFDIVETSIDENGIATLQLSFTDVGSLDTHTVDIDWGDGTTETVNLSLGQTTLTIQHQYLDDDPTATPSDVYTVGVTITDDDGGVVSDTTTVIVNNLDPEVILNSVSDIDENGIATLTGSITDVGTLDTFTIEINWGDPLSPPNTQIFNLGTTTLTEAVDGIDWDPISRTFSITHQYLDDNPSGTNSDTYTIQVDVTDDDTGTDDESATVVVNNLDPEVILDAVSDIDENGIATLTGSITDVGTLDVVFDIEINWGDPLSPDNVQTFTLGTTALTEAVDGINWDPSTGEFSITHQYLDDNPTGTDSDTYTITLDATDDDTGVGTGTTTVVVNNVAPNVLLNTIAEIDENGIATLSGTVTDVGTLDVTFDIVINWGDPLSPDDVQTFTFGTTALTEAVDGINWDPITGEFSLTHQYLDNDADEIFTITVTATDDDTTPGESTGDVTVNNIAPTLFTIEAIDVNTAGETIITITMSDPGNETVYLVNGNPAFTAQVDWGYITGDSSLDGFQGDLTSNDAGFSTLTTFVYQAGTTIEVVLPHQYMSDQLPNPANPAADLLIQVRFVDDDGAESNTLTITITNPGIGASQVRVDTTPQVPRLTFQRDTTSELTLEDRSTSDLAVTDGEIRSTSSDAQVASEQVLELRVIDSYGRESEGIRLKAEVLNNLPGLFYKLPDNHYIIYLVREETNSERLVIEIYLRKGRIIDPSDDMQGVRKRPPVEQQIQVEQTPEDAVEDPEISSTLQEIKKALEAELAPGTDIQIEPVDQGNSRENSNSMLLPVTTGLVASRSFGSWAMQVDRSLAQASGKKWRQLRRRKPGKRKIR